MIPTKNRESGERLIVILVVAILVLVGGLVIAGLSALADHLAPKVGDIISFPPSNAPPTSTASITVRQTARPPRATCVLDVQVIEKSGGSLVIESADTKPNRQFVVHWAGPRTSRGQHGCGNSADLVLNATQIAALIFAAGGTGAKTAQK